MNRRRLLTEYIRQDAEEELDYFTVIPYSDTGGGLRYINVAGGTATLQDGTTHIFYLSYSIDGGGWISCERAQLAVYELSRVRFKCNMYEVLKNESDVRYFELPSISTYDNTGDWWLIEGTPISLLHGDNFKEHKNDLISGCFYQMFRNNKACYQINNPKTFLPSTELAPRCYEYMFYGSSILNAPELPAETLEEGCYLGMFAHCGNLKEAPALNAKTPVVNCYREMFYNCSNLSYLKIAATEEIGELDYMFRQGEDFGLVVLSQEFIDAKVAGSFFPDWAAVSDEYPTNGEGYPETDMSSEEYPVFFNAGFQQRIYDESEGMYSNYYYSAANEVGEKYFELLLLSEVKETWRNITSSKIFFNRRPAYNLFVTDDYVIFSIGGGEHPPTAYLYKNGSIQIFEYDKLIPDYLKK